MGAVYVTTVGPIEESTDLWDLFQKDARAVYGLFPGQLWSELVERGPQFRDRVVEIIKRGLLSDDPEERRAAIEAVRLVPSPAYANALTQIAAKYRSWIASQKDYTGEPILKLFLSAVIVGKIKPAFDALADVWANSPAQEAGLNALVALYPERAIDRLTASGEANFASPDAQLLIRSLASSPHWDRAQEKILQLPAVQRKAFVAAARAAMRADEFAAAFDAWQALSKRLGVSAEVEQRPLEDERVVAFRKRIPALLADEDATTTPADSSVVLAAEVWVDMLRMAEGPPAELAELLRQRQVSVFTSEPLIERVATLLSNAGWTTKQVEAAKSRIRQGSSVQSCTEQGNIEARLAIAAGLPHVFAIGPRTSSSVEGISFVPVNALTERLRRGP